MQKIGRVIVKVLKTYVPQRIGSGLVKHCIVKDQYGDKGKIDLWDQRMDNVSEGMILEITNLKVKDYPYQKPHELRDDGYKTVIKNVTESMQQEFQGIVLDDDKSAGIIECFHTVYAYDSCKSCTKSISKEDKVCKKCHKTSNFWQT